MEGLELRGSNLVLSSLGNRCGWETAVTGADSHFRQNQTDYRGNNRKEGQDQRPEASWSLPGPSGCAGSKVRVIQRAGRPWYWWWPGSSAVEGLECDPGHLGGLGQRLWSGWAARDKWSQATFCSPVPSPAPVILPADLHGASILVIITTVTSEGADIALMALPRSHGRDCGQLKRVPIGLPARKMVRALLEAALTGPTAGFLLG